MVLSYPAFFTIYSVSIVVAFFLGVLVLMGWKEMSLRRGLISLRYNAVYIIILIAFPLLLILSQNMAANAISGPGDTSKEVHYTNWIFSIAGGAVAILQDRLNHAIVTDLFAITYVWLFTFLTGFVPILLLAKDDRATLRTYAIATVLNYLVLAPFYIFFPVTVTGSNIAAQTTPLLYADPNWGRMVTSVDPLNNDFPSAHVSLSTTTFLVFVYAGSQYKRFSYFLGVSTIAVVFAVLYLGVHWPADVFAGFLVAVGATVAARSDRVQMTIDRYVRIISRRLLNEKEPPDD
jgi:membrane-associated phospholipid phosphatase